MGFSRLAVTRGSTVYEFQVPSTDAFAHADSRSLSCGIGRDDDDDNDGSCIVTGRRNIMYNDDVRADDDVYTRTLLSMT